MKTILESFLSELNIKYTHKYASKLYNEHPNKYNMLGLQQMLQTYGVKTKGIKVSIRDLEDIPVPCIFHVHGDFFIGTNITEKNVMCIWSGKKVTCPIHDFEEMWTGDTLIVEEKADAIEPNYKKNMQKDFFKHVFAWAIMALSLFAMFAAVYENKILTSFIHCAYIVVDILGLATCCLLMQKELFTTSKYGDKVCSILHHQDCNNILSSDKAKFYGINWSEIGLAYFIGHLISSIFIPASLPSLEVVNVLAMTYGIWSVYYQYKIAKQWCMLCLIVQILLWTNGLITLMKYMIAEKLPMVSVGYFIMVVLFIGILILIIHGIKDYVVKMKKMESLTQQYNELKYSPDIFKTLLTKGNYYVTTKEDSSIILGNPNAKMKIVIFSNPHCNPCAQMHKHVEKLLMTSRDAVSIQYIFTSFSKEVNTSNKFLIGAMQQLKPDMSNRVYKLWYEGGKNNAQDFFKLWDVKINTPAIEEEMKRHELWKNRTKIDATPTVIVNGYSLPKEYELEDLPLLADVII